MTDYTRGEHALPFPEGGDRVAVHGDIQALAVSTDLAITAEGAAAKAHTDALGEYVQGYGFPVDGPDFEDFVDVVVDRNSNVASGTKTDGTTYVARMESERTIVGAEALTGDWGTKYQSVTHDRGYWIAEPAAIDATGRTPEWVLRNHASRTGKALLGVACFGDSMTAGLGGGGVSYPQVLMRRTEKAVWNYGISGQSSTEIALRSGGLDVWVTVAGGRIPESGAVDVTHILPGSKWHETSSWSYPGVLAGIRGTLSKSAAGAWSFTRAAAGDAVSVAPETRWQPEHQPTPLVGRIIWVGRNYPVQENVLRDVRAMVADAQRVNAPYLVIPPFNNGSEPAGSAGYANITAIGQALEKEHGPNCYDLRGYIIRRGLSDSGKTPTVADTTAISEDRIPPSLMSDNIHLNGAGYTVAGNRLADVTTMKGWF